MEQATVGRLNTRVLNSVEYNRRSSLPEYLHQGTGYYGSRGLCVRLLPLNFHNVTYNEIIFVKINWAQYGLESIFYLGTKWTVVHSVPKCKPAAHNLDLVLKSDDLRITFSGIFHVF